MKVRTTGSATSASSSAILISRQVASMSAGDRRPRLRSDEKTWFSRSESVSNTCGALLRAGYPALLSTRSRQPCPVWRLSEQSIDERSRVERRQVVWPFAQADELDRNAELALHRDHDAALGRAVELGQHHSGDVD